MSSQEPASMKGRLLGAWWRLLGPGVGVAVGTWMVLLRPPLGSPGDLLMGLLIWSILGAWYIDRGKQEEAAPSRFAVWLLVGSAGYFLVGRLLLLAWKEGA